MLSSLLFTLLWLSAIIGSARISYIVLRGQPRMLVILGGCAILPVLVQFQVLLAGVAGVLTAPVVLAISVAIALLSLKIKPHESLVPPSEDRPAKEYHHPLWAVTLAGALLGAFLFRSLWLRQAYMVDDLSYHAMAPALWIQAKALVFAPPNYHAYYPFSPHTFAAWLMLPFGNDGLVCLSGAYWLLLSSGAVYVLARQMGVRPGMAILTALGIPLAREAMRNALTFVGTDVAGMAYILAATAMVRAAMGARHGRWPLLFAGLFAGYAVGAKISFAPLAFLLLMVVLFQPDRWARGTIFSVAAVVSGGFWYARNLLWTGNPVYPAPLGPLPGTMSSSLLTQTKLITWLTNPPDGKSHVETVFWNHLDWPYALGVVAMTGIVLAPLALWLMKRRQKPALLLTGMLFLLASAALLCYPFMPFSGTNNGSATHLRIDLRFILAPYACGLLLLAAFETLGGWWRRLSMAFMALGVFVGTNTTFVDLGVEFNNGELAAMFGGGLAMLIYRFFSMPNARIVAKPAVALLLAAIVLFRIGTFADTRQQLNRGYLAYFGKVGKAWKKIDALTEPQRVTMFGPGSYMTYPLLGRDFQHTYVPVNGNGTARLPLHVLPAETPPQTADLASNLIAQNVTIALVSQWDRKNGKWPSQYETLKKDPRAEILYDDGYSAIYKLTPASQ